MFSTVIDRLFSRWKYEAIYWKIFTLLVAFLVAVNINLVIFKFRELGSIGIKAGGIGSAGVFGGILGGACPGCFVGLFPAFLGLFGISASLSVLPLLGLEIQIVSVILLVASMILLTRDNTCDPKKE